MSALSSIRRRRQPASIGFPHLRQRMGDAVERLIAALDASTIVEGVRGYGADEREADGMRRLKLEKPAAC